MAMIPLKEALISKNTVSNFGSMSKVNLDKKYIYKFGYILHLANGIDYITIGKKKFDYIKKYLKEIKLSSVQVMAVIPDENAEGWNFIEYEDYSDTFPKSAMYQNFDIAGIYSTDLAPADIDTPEKLKKVFERFKLKRYDT